MPHIHVKDLCLEYPIFSPPPEERKDGRRTLVEAAGAVLPVGRVRLSRVQALKNVSFKVEAGQRLGLIGRNGSGKSTLLRAMAGVYEPTSGIVDIEGCTAPLFSVGLGTRVEATGRRNIYLRGFLRGLTRAQIDEKIDEIIEFCELGRYIDLPVRSYSSGMAVRLAFAIATSFTPEILLLDEWLGAGDRDFQEKARNRMRALVNRAGITVMASHNRPLLREVCDLGLWLDRGVARAFGPIGEVYKALDESKHVEQQETSLSAPDIEAVT